MRNPTSALTALLSASCMAANAWAFDPNAGAEDTATPVARYTRQPNDTAPRHHFAPLPTAPAVSPAPVAYTTPAPAPRPLVIAPLPEVAAAPVQPSVVLAPPQTRMVPVEQPMVNAMPMQEDYAPPPVATVGSVPVAPVENAYVAPQPVPYYDQQYTKPNNDPAFRTNRYAVGVEYFFDRYKEPIADLNSTTNYGALDLGWTHYYTPRWFHELEGRASYGQEDYKSSSGTVDGTDQYEFEGRFLLGYDFAIQNGGHLKPYLGADMRYYRDESKGTVTNLGFSGYDRRIFQTMLPIGVTLDMPGQRFHYVPTIEVGPVIYSAVSTRLGNIPGYYNLKNKQDSGYEMRAELMINSLDEEGRGWEFGPFVRYWKFDDSDIYTTPPAGPTNATQWIEPENSRLQLGAKVSYLF